MDYYFVDYRAFNCGALILPGFSRNISKFREISSENVPGQLLAVLAELAEEGCTHYRTDVVTSRNGNMHFVYGFVKFD